MNKIRPTWFFFFSMLLLALAGCEDDDSTSLEADLTGIWTLSASASDPPRAVACTGNLSPLSGTLLCPFFQLELEQIATVVTGGSAEPFCDADLTFTGTVSGSNVSGSYLVAGETSVRTIAFTAFVTGDSASFEPDLLTQTGSTGNCTVSGVYSAARSIAEPRDGAAP